MNDNTETQQEPPDWTGTSPAMADFLDPFTDICFQAFQGIPNSDHLQAFFRGEGYDGKATGEAFISSRYFGILPPKLPTDADITSILTRCDNLQDEEVMQAEEVAEIR